MPEHIEEINPSHSNANLSRKVPRHTQYMRWVKIGFFFALGAVGLIILAEIGSKIVDSILEIIGPFATAMVLALLLDPVVDRMQTKGIPRVLAVAIVFLVFIGAVALILVFTIPTLISQASTLAANIPTYISSNKANVNQFLLTHKQIGPFKMPRNFDVLTAQVSLQVGSFIERQIGSLGAAVLISVSTVIEVIITLIAGFYLLVDIDRIRARFFFLSPTRYRHRLAQIGKDIGKVFSDYLRGLVIVCALYGLTTQIAVYGLAFVPKYGHEAIGQYALLLGASAGVLYAIPYLGSFTIGIVTFLVAFSAGGFRFGLLALALTLVVNQTFDNVIAPRIIGGGNGLNPVFVIFSLSLGGALFGLGGLLLAVPVAASIQVIVFRLYPKFAEPTPTSFLLEHGVPPNKGATSQILVPEAEKERESTSGKSQTDSAP